MKKFIYKTLELKVDISYQGKPFDIPKVKPSKENLETDESAVFRLSGYLINQYTDKIKTSYKKGWCYIKLHFDH